jgi:hypothetical protein
MPDDTMTNATPEPIGSAEMKSYFKALHKAVRLGKKGLTKTENPEVQRILGEHVSGAEKACGVLRKAHGKMYKDYPIEDDDTLAKMMDDEESSYGEWKKSLSAKKSTHAEPDGDEGGKPQPTPPAEGGGGNDMAAPSDDGDMDEEETLEVMKAITQINERLETLAKAV